MAEEPARLVTFQSMTVELALQASEAALNACRAKGYQVAVAVVDRGGNTQVLLRDRFAGPHTPRTATGKAWTAVSFRTGTGELAELIETGEVERGLHHIPGAVVVGGGLVIQAGGSIVGGIGVSGAPGGDLDEECSQAGIDAIGDALNF